MGRTMLEMNRRDAGEIVSVIAHKATIKEASSQSWAIGDEPERATS